MMRLAAPATQGSGRQRQSRQPALFLACAFLLLGIAGWLVLPFRGMPGEPAMQLAADDPAASRPVLIFASAGRLSARDSWLARHLLAEAGFASASWSGSIQTAAASADDRQAEVLALAGAVRETAVWSGRPATDIWVIAAPGLGSRLLDLLPPGDIGGLVLLSAPSDLDLADLARSPWRQNGRLIILSHAADASARSFFTHLTGEDATLFPGRPVGQHTAGTWQSSDGRVSLTLFTTWKIVPLLADPLLLAELAVQLGEHSGDSQAAAALSLPLASRMAGWMFRLGLSLCLLLTVPLLFLLQRPASDQARTGQPAQMASWPLLILIWFAALLLALLLAIALQQVWPRQVSWPAALILLAPAFSGWLNFLWQTLVARPAIVSRRVRTADAGPAEGVKTSLLGQLAVWLAFLAVPALLYPVWQLLPLPAALPAAWLVLPLILMNLSLGPIGLSAGSCRPIPALRRSAGIRSLLPVSLFWLVLSLILILQRGITAAWPVLPAAFLFYWSLYSGISLCRTAGSRWAASLFQSACYSWLAVPFLLMPG